jgi:hypothetical protein
VSLILVDVPRRLPLPFVSTSPIKIHVWNRLVEDYMVHVFDVANKFLASDGAILLFHHDNLHVLKEIRSFLESYSFHIWMKWAIVNSLPLTSSEDLSMKVLI